MPYLVAIRAWSMSRTPATARSAKWTARAIVRRNLVAGAGPEHLVIDAKAERLYAADADAGRVLELALESGETLPGCCPVSTG